MVQLYDEDFLHKFQESTEQSNSESIFKILSILIFDKNTGQNIIGLSVNKGSKKSISKAVLDKYAYIWWNYYLCHSCNLIVKFA